MIYALIFYISVSCVNLLTIGIDLQEKDFSLFIKSLHSREIIRKEAKYVYIMHFGNTNNFFCKKVRTQTGLLFFKKTEYYNHKDLLKITSIHEISTSLFKIYFESIHGGCLYQGSVTIIHEQDKSILVDCFYSKRIE